MEMPVTRAAAFWALATSREDVSPQRRAAPTVNVDGALMRGNPAEKRRYSTMVI
jgi:hypothetical protein